MDQLIRMRDVVASLLYSIIGVIIFWVAMVIIDKLTPGNWWEEILEKQNVAVAIVTAGLAVGISIIVGLSIH